MRWGSCSSGLGDVCSLSSCGKGKARDGWELAERNSISILACITAVASGVVCTVAIITTPVGKYVVFRVVASNDIVRAVTCKQRIFMVQVKAIVFFSLLIRMF